MQQHALPHSFEKHENGGIYLNHDAMKKFLAQLKINLQTPHKEGGEKRSYMSFIRHNIHELSESFAKQDPTLFNPFIHKVQPMYVILAYEVSQRSSSRIMKTCRKYLKHFQKSVFEEEISEKSLNKLKNEPFTSSTLN